MIDYKIEIENYFKKNNIFVKQEDLKKKMSIRGKEQTDLFYSALNELVEEGCLFFDPKKGYKLFTNDLGYAYGEIEINKSGNGFVHTQDGYTIFIKNEDLNGALNGDKVIVSSIDFGRRDEFKGEVHKVLKRKTGNIIYEVVGNGYNASLVPYNKNEAMPININKNELKNLVDGEFVLLNVSAEKKYGEYEATIKKVVGHKNEPNIDLKMIYIKRNIPIEFSEEALKEAENMPTEVTEDDIKGKVDLRQKQFLTIDCDDTKDRDDAVYAEKLPNGNIKLYVAISLIDYYVKRGSKIYEEAMERCTSHYAGGACVPMFPPKLSNGICSLNENVDRLARIFEMEIDSEGTIKDFDVYTAVINSKKQMKYSECNKIFKGESVEGYQDFIEQLKLHKEVSDRMDKYREKIGSIDFDLDELTKKIDENGKAQEFTTRGSGISERIIENEMLMSGFTAAEYFSWLPFIFRIQEPPNPKSLMNVFKILRLSGIDIPKFNNINETTINNVLNRIKNREDADIIRTMILRATKRARYSTTNLGHFALQVKKHCHITAPIRRGTDFRTNMLISDLETLEFTEENMKRLEAELEDICKKASEAERIAQEIEDEAMAMDMAEYMQEHIGDEYSGIITEIYSHGMFVKTSNNITGKVKFENMLDDRYRYNPDKRAIIGAATKKKYQIGNKVFVVVKDACKETRTINFQIGKQKSLRK